MPKSLGREARPESLNGSCGTPGCRVLSLPTSFSHTKHWQRRLHSAIAITNQTRATIVLLRTRLLLLVQGWLSPTQRLISSLGYTWAKRARSTCSHTLSSTFMCRNLYI